MDDGVVQAIAVGNVMVRGTGMIRPYDPVPSVVIMKFGGAWRCRNRDYEGRSEAKSMLEVEFRTCEEMRLAEGLSPLLEFVVLEGGPSVLRRCLISSNLIKQTLVLPLIRLLT
jgi:hypothetical protein